MVCLISVGPSLIFHTITSANLCPDTDLYMNINYSVVSVHYQACTCQVVESGLCGIARVNLPVSAMATVYCTSRHVGFVDGWCHRVSVRSFRQPDAQQPDRLKVIIVGAPIVSFIIRRQRSA